MWSGIQVVMERGRTQTVIEIMALPPPPLQALSLEHIDLFLLSLNMDVFVHLVLLEVVVLDGDEGLERGRVLLLAQRGARLATRGEETGTQSYHTPHNHTTIIPHATQSYHTPKTNISICQDSTLGHSVRQGRR